MNLNLLTKRFFRDVLQNVIGTGRGAAIVERSTPVGPFESPWKIPKGKKSA